MKVARGPSQREGHLVFSGPGTQMAWSAFRMELSDPGARPKLHVQE